MSKTKPISLDDLNPDQKAELLKELEAKQRESQQKIKAERVNYKSLVNETVLELFPKLKKISDQLSEIKSNVFNDLKSLVTLKAELYQREEDQWSHSFTTIDGGITITIGKNVIDGWDDTVNTGIAKVNDFIKSMAKDDNSEKLVNTILKLLSKDSKGNLKASRVLVLKKMAEDTGDKKFIDAINIIQDAYRPVPSQEYVRCICKNDKGEKSILPLSISEALMYTDNIKDAV